MATLFLFKIRQNKTLLEGKRYKNTILSYNEKIGGILQLLEGNSEYLPDSETSIGETSSQDIQEVVRMVIFCYI